MPRLFKRKGGSSGKGRCAGDRVAQRRRVHAQRRLPPRRRQPPAGVHTMTSPAATTWRRSTRTAAPVVPQPGNDKEPQDDGAGCGWGGAPWRGQCRGSGRTAGADAGAGATDSWRSAEPARAGASTAWDWAGRTGHVLARATCQEISRAVPLLQCAFILDGCFDMRILCRTSLPPVYPSTEIVLPWRWGGPGAHTFVIQSCSGPFHP